MDKLKYLNKLTGNIKFSKAAKIITKTRLKVIYKLADKYMENPDDENLHKLRIAVRRMRFAYEMFKNVYTEEIYTHTLKELKKLQDVFGLARDNDVMLEKLYILSKDVQLDIPKKLINKLEKNKTEMRQKISQELLKFKGDNIIQSLLN
ncbi:MAG: CHAD domain-containing protein [Ignavibacteria bacterium]|nr:MAG: CHAD domain-containing protein [Ignavibacteria bacterium]